MDTRKNLFIKKILFFISLFLFFTAVLIHSEEKGWAGSIEEILTPLGTKGKQYVLLIAIDRYEDKKWPDLKNPVRDTQEIKAILEQNYFIDEVMELYNKEATKEKILICFSNLQKKLTIHDSIFIFYAGHGYYDNLTQTGFWIPSDAGYNPFKQENWIPHQQIKGSIQNCEAKHILLLSDSCFAGDIIDIHRGGKIERPEPDKEYIIDAINKLSREVITSGGMEPVRDKSEFAALVKMALKSNEKTFFDSIDLYQYIRGGISSAKPVYGTLPMSKHQQGGLFYFYRQTHENPLPDGKLCIATRKPGTLFLNGEPLGPINPFSQVIKVCPPGSMIVVLQYDDGTEEIKQIEVKSGNLSEVLFIGFSTMQDQKKNYFIYSSGIGLSFPLGFWGDISDIGFSPTISVQYAVKLPAGYFLCGLLSGVGFGSIREDLDDSYTFTTLPIGITAGYLYQFNIPVSLFIEAGGGMVVSLLKFRNIGEDQDTFKTPFLSLTSGVGVSITRMIGVSLFGRISCQIYSNIKYWDISPGVRLDILL
ncbi:MAG: caspase family protein [Spirochaetales bacterium]|nr:caspase family protein [Spirochaetales bacterium]